MIVTLPVITGTVNTAVHIVVGSMETLNLTARIVTRWMFERTMNEKRDAYITLLTAAQKQIPQEVNLVVEEHFIPNCPFPQQIPKGWACPVCGREVDDDAHYCKYCGQAICDD